MKHELKTWPRYFQAIKDGIKNFEIRENDRDFKVGDTLVLKEYSPTINKFTGRKVTRQVSCILHGGQFGLAKGYCIMGLSG